LSRLILSPISTRKPWFGQPAGAHCLDDENDPQFVRGRRDCLARHAVRVKADSSRESPAVHKGRLRFAMPDLRIITTDRTRGSGRLQMRWRGWRSPRSRPGANPGEHQVSTLSQARRTAASSPTNPRDPGESNRFLGRDSVSTHRFLTSSTRCTVRV